ncbi:MAG: hypothetical protein ACYCPW_10160, partial [Nitrososphaerales archaeon]
MKAQQLLSESFQWAQQLYPILKQFQSEEASFYKVVASTADVKNRNGRVYTSDELAKAASSLSERPLNINHDPDRELPFPDNQVVVARFEDGLVECIIQVTDEKTNVMIENGEINSVSIEGLYIDGSKNTQSTEFPTSLHFQALALLTSDDQPGDPSARILRENTTSPNAIRISGQIHESIQISKNYGDKITMSQQTVQVVKDESWTAKDIDNLPDSSFAYIAKGGKKDEEGKTVPRS